MPNPTGIGGPAKGEIRNPNGRTPQDKSLTNLLRRGGSQRIVLPNGKRVNRNKELAEMLWDAVLTGRLNSLENGKEKISARDRLSLAQWLFNRIDGMPRQALEVTQTPQEIIITSDEMAAAMKELEEFTNED